MDKVKLRKKYIKIRKNIINKEYQNEIIFKKIISDKKINSANTILIYVSFNDEVDTYKIINHFLGKKKIAIPKIINNSMEFYYINSLKDLEKGYFNIMEPTTKTKVTNYDDCVCIVPGICFDKYNNRIGYGKGFYDRFLKDKDIYTIGITYTQCIIDNIPYEINDIKLNKVITSN